MIARLLLLVSATLLASPALAEVSDMAIRRGKVIAEQSCARCHAIGRKGASPMRDATAFRRISRKYPIRNLEEAFGEGDTANHKGMPDFAFTPAQVADLIDYMRSVQPKRR